jgi:atypical dual specificity phosphatase
MSASSGFDAERITEEVWCGSTLEAGDIGKLARMGIRRVVNLETWQRYDFDAVRRAGMEFFNIPIQDLDLPISERVIEKAVIAIDESARRGHQVYVHCTAGWQRSPAIIACYLIFKGMTAEAALSLVKERRPVARFYSSHIASAIEFESKLRSLRASRPPSD